ncbi:MAG TPA: hypothetical protein VGD37_15890 [Kofleriaceae bacterium]|jgi:hypothetical protein
MTDAAPPSAPGGPHRPNGRSLVTPTTATGASPRPADASTAAPVVPASGPLPRLDRPARSALHAELPSTAALALARAPGHALELALVRGATPELEALVGWEFRGINTTPEGAPPIARLAGIQKFVKGMFRSNDGRAMGYNTPVVQNVLDGRWQPRPSDAEPKRFGFYSVAPVDPTSRDNHYLHALLIDYSKGGNPAWNITRGLRDYLVQVDAGNPDLFLGKAYAAIGPARVALGYFVLERWRRGPASVLRR